jgi:hypothetical protein
MYKQFYICGMLTMTLKALRIHQSQLVAQGAQGHA